MQKTWLIFFKKSHEKVFVFSAAVRGYHFYKDTGKPEENRQLIYSHETQSLFDVFAIKTSRMSDNKIVGHLPRQISRATKFLLDRGANVTARLSSTHYRRSPLFQGGLEIPCTVKGFLSCQRRSRYVERKVQRNS